MLSTGCGNQNNQKHFNRERGSYWKFRLNCGNGLGFFRVSVCYGDNQNLECTVRV